MSKHDTRTRRRGSSAWSEHFSNPQSVRRTAGDEAATASVNQTGTVALLYGDDVLKPPCFNMYPLEMFLKSTGVCERIPRSNPTRLPKSCLLEDRSLEALSPQIHTDGDTAISSINEIAENQRVEELRDMISKEALNERDLARRLEQKLDVDRRIMMIANITPLCGRVLSSNKIPEFPLHLAHFVQSHIGGEILFSANVQNLASPFWGNPKRYTQVEYNFTMRFHISYVALRPGAANSDPRGLRQSYSMIKPIESAFDDLYYHDAQVSFLVAGTNEIQWSAYCLVDTFFGGEQDAEEYVRRRQDGPSGGARQDTEPCWDPREYFLLVLSQRLSQISREWGNFLTVLMSRLDLYESFYIRTIDTNNLSDDQSLTRTNSYTKAVSIMRQSHDTLSTTLETLHNFLNDTEIYFEKKDSAGQDLWRGFYVLIQSETDHLELWDRRVGQRMQRFEAMKNGLVSYSALEESRRSTRQGSDIGVLTNMTVAYLPFNLAAAIFSLSSATPSGHIWVYWAIISFILGLITFYFAFGNRVRHSYARWSARHGPEPPAKLEA